MQDNVIFIIGCFILAGFFCEIAWSVYLYTMRKVEYFFYHRYLDKISKEGTIE